MSMHFSNVNKSDSPTEYDGFIFARCTINRGNSGFILFCNSNAAPSLHCTYSSQNLKIIICLIDWISDIRRGRNLKKKKTLMYNVYNIVVKSCEC